MNEALGQTPEGRMLVLKNTLGSIRSEIGRGVLPIIMKLLPYLQAVANWFLRAAQAVSAFTAALFGKVDTGIGAGAIDAQAESVDELGGAYEDAEKKAKKAQKKLLLASTRSTWSVRSHPKTSLKMGFQKAVLAA